jgi:uncharacterized protein YjbI with pentapeptide repeats
VSRSPSRGLPADRPLVLPDLTPFTGERLEPRRDYDTTDFVERDFAGDDGPDIRFLECRLQRCNLDGASLRRARILGSLLEGVTAATIDLADSVWRDSDVLGGRLGAVNLAGANLTRIRIQGTRLGFLNLAGGQLDEVRFEGCEIDGIDARAGQLRALSFVDCSIGELNVTEARLTKVDLSEARLRSLVGVDNLRGAIISRAQLLDLAPLLAEQLGLDVRPD